MNVALATLRRQPWLVTLAALAGLVVVNVLLQPNFTQARVLQSNLTTFLPLVLVAIGQTYVILAGDIDLSVGSIVALVNVVTVSTVVALGGSGQAILLALAAGIGAGLACGLFNGLCIALLRFQPIVTTFATGVIFSALALWVMPRAGVPVPPTYWRSYAGDVLGLPLVLWILLAAVGFVGLLARWPYQRHLLAVGGNRQGAYQSGLGVARIRMGAFVLSALFSALAALCLVGETASGDPLMGLALSLSSIAAVVIGGTALSGGFGGAFGSVLGALLLGMIGNVIFFAGLPFQYQTLVQGLIVLLALAGGVLVTRR